MAAKKKQDKKQLLRKKAPSYQRSISDTAETRASEALTVCWGVTITILTVCNLIVIAAQIYVMQVPDAKQTALLADLLLMAGSMVGLLSLILLPILFRVRQTPPPNGVAVFGACLAIAPILGLIFKIVA